MFGSSRTQKYWLLSLILIILLVGFGVAIWRPWHKPGAGTEIKVGYLPIYVDLPLFVAEQRSFFSRRGMKVNLIRFETSPDMASALAGGRIDAAASVATNSALSIETRDPGLFRVFMVDAETRENPLSALLVASSSRVKTVRDLKGTTIGSFPGPTAQLFAPLALEKLGLPRGSYRIQELPVTSHLPALETGTVSAIVTYEPYATMGEMRYHSRRLVPALIESQVMSPWQAGIWIVSADFLNRNPEASNTFVHAIYEAKDFIRNHPKEAKEALRSRTSIPLDIAEQTPDIPFTAVDEADWVALQRQADLLTKNGTLSRHVDVGSLAMSVTKDGS